MGIRGQGGDGNIRIARSRIYNYTAGHYLRKTLGVAFAETGYNYF